MTRRALAALALASAFAALAPAAHAAPTLEEIAAMRHHERRGPLDAFIAQFPASAEGHFQLGVWFYEEERLSDAIESFKKAMALDAANFKAVANAGLVLERMNKSAEALALYEGFLAKNPSDARAAAHYGEALWSAGRRSEGVAQYRKALEIDSHCVEAHFNLGSAFAEMGIFREAMREWEHVVKAGAPEGLVSQARINIKRAEPML